MENNKPVVKLISKPENMLKTIYTACRTCYSADSPVNIYDNAADEEKMLKLIERVISSGHYSTIEHIQVSFAISNVSRACTHQFVRHRHVSFSQKSQRYVKEKGQFDYITPPTIEKNDRSRHSGRRRKICSAKCSSQLYGGIAQSQGVDSHCKYPPLHTCSI